MIGLIYVPAAQTVVPSYTHAVAPALGTLPVPQAVAGELPPVHTRPEGHTAHAVAPLFTIWPATQATGAVEPPAHALPAVQAAQYGPVTEVDGLMYVPAAQTVVPSCTHAVAFTLGILPVPQAEAGELPPEHARPEGHAAQAVAPLFTI